MRLLQLHEYLAILDGKNETLTPPPDDPRVGPWLDVAERLWPKLGLDPWSARPRRVEHITRCGKGGESLVHVNADWKDCFLILVVPPNADGPTSHILFDIGAEYREILFSCPAFGLELPVEEEMIRDLLPRLGDEPDPFAILGKSGGTYMQVYADGRRYSVEHQLVTTACHYELRSPISAKAAVELCIDYAFGKYDWARNRQWKLQRL